MGGAVAGAAPAPAVPPPGYTGLYRAPIDFWLTSMNLSVIGPPWSTLTAYDLNKGAIKWHKNLRTDFGGEPGEWAYSESPLVDGDTLVVTPGGRTSLVALNKRTGDSIWRSVAG